MQGGQEGMGVKKNESSGDGGQLGSRQRTGEVWGTGGRGNEDEHSRARRWVWESGWDGGRQVL